MTALPDPWRTQRGPQLADLGTTAELAVWLGTAVFTGLAAPYAQATFARYVAMWGERKVAPMLARVYEDLRISDPLTSAAVHRVRVRSYSPDLPVDDTVFDAVDHKLATHAPARARIAGEDPDVAVFFTGADRPIAVRLQQRLQSASRRVFVDEGGIPLGALWGERIKRVIGVATGFVLLLRQSGPSWYFHDEIVRVIERGKHGASVVPVWLDGIPSDPEPVPYGLAAVQAVSALVGEEALVARLNDELPRRTA